jgi:hypothetical protein
MRNENQKQNGNKEETTMKATNVMKASMLTAALALACLLPATARAQAEVAPDNYDIAAPQTLVAAQPALATTKTHAAANFDGKFSLPYNVTCSGKALTAGAYSLSVKSEGSNRVVTIHRNGEDTNLVVRRVSQRSASSTSALLLRRAGPARTLEAVYVQQLNAVLYLDATANARGPIERLPIS